MKFLLMGLILLMLSIGCRTISSDIPHCMQTATSGQCLQCDQDFFPSQNGHQCEQVIDIGLMGMIHQRTLAVNCTNGTSQVNGVCVACNLTGCLDCSSESFCSDCQTAYQLNSEAGFCLVCNISNCTSCSAAYVCEQCSSGSPTQDGNLCVACNHTNCRVCNSGNNCVSCDDGFGFNQAGLECVTCNVAGCANCTANDSCAVCQRGYDRDSASGTCFLCKDPCLTCLAGGRCQTCNTPSYSKHPNNSTGDCYVCEATNCDVCQQEDVGICTTCLSGYALQANGTCTRICSDRNCMTCSAAGVCQICNYFYVLEAVSCNSCFDGSKCKECTSSQPGQCVQCNVGYFISSGECLPCAEDCGVCSSSTSCLSLKNSVGRTIIDGGAADCNVGCKVCSPTNAQVCITCDDGFANNGQECVACSEECKTCDPNAPNNCTSCQNDVILTGVTCAACNSSCLSCRSTDLNYCTECFFGFIESNGKCDVQCAENCQSCKTSENCTKCEDQYGVNSTGYCVPCLGDCLECNGDIVSICLKCGEGFIPTEEGSTGGCLSCPDNCQKCSKVGDITVCNQCEEGFHVSHSFTCQIDCDSPCATCQGDDPNICFSCLAGYGFNRISQTCSPVQSCNGGCKYCPFGWTLRRGVCKQCADSCARCRFDTPSRCTSCRYGQYLDWRNRECNSCPEGCRSCYNQNYCRSCIRGYFRKRVPAERTRICQKCESPCRTCYYRPTRCTTCISGYFRSGSRCVTSYNFGFRLVLSITFRLFFRRYVIFLFFIRRSCQVSSIRYIVMVVIRSGSAEIQGVASQDSQAASLEAHSSFSSALEQGGQIQGMPILSSGITVNGGDLPEPTISTLQEAIRGNSIIMLAIVLPLIAITIIGAIVLFLVYRYRKRSPVQVMETESNDNIMMNSELKVTQEKEDFKIHQSAVQNQVDQSAWKVKPI